MRKLYLLVILLAIAGTAMSQKSVEHVSMNADGLSPKAAMLLLDLRTDKSALSSDRYSVVTVGSQRCLPAFILPSEGVDEKQLGVYGVSVVERGTLYSVLIPVERFEALATSGLCKYIDLGNKAELYINRVRGDFSADEIHAGVGLPQGYDGTGVVVGIIDIGFEFTHPTFLSATDSTLRIKRVWNQRDTSGTAPVGFGYGSEYTTPAQILAAGSCGYPHTHGTHVAGIAAGCGAPDTNSLRYKGIAPAADIVLVPTTLQDPDVFNGILYIHRYARSVGKPCVINMSLGTQMGSHDGLTGFDASIANYIGATDSIVVVASAANDGSTRVHLQREFTENNNAVTTALTCSDDEDLNYGVDIWGRVGDTFNVTLSLYNIAGDTMETVSPTIQCVAGADSVYLFNLTSAGDSAYQCMVATTGENPLNHRPNVSITVFKPGVVLHPQIHEMLLTISSPSAHVHAWGQGVKLTQSFVYSAAVAGDDEYSIGGLGANGNHVISVGSYTTRRSWATPSGESSVSLGFTEGDISYFSSHGPTIDGRTKPDIAAPGSTIVSSVNRFWSNYLINDYLYDSLVWNGHTEYYATMNGTSMSSPAVAGVMALWLQHNPALNVDSARTLLHASAITDEYTDTIGPLGNNTWGWGKINTFGGLPQSTVNYHYLSVYPANYFMGTVEGMGRHPEGLNTITAYPFNGYNFIQWSDGSTDNPRQIDLSSDTMLTALFERENDCDTIFQFPSSLELDENSNCWYNIDGDGDERIWSFMGTGLVSMDVGTTPSNNWLLTPPIKAVNGLIFKFIGQAIYNDHKFIISVAEESIDTADFTTVLLEQMIPTSAPVNLSVSLSAFAGRTIRMAFRACESTSSVLMLKNLEFTINEHEGIANTADGTFIATTQGLNLILKGILGEPVTVYDAIGRVVLSSHSATDGIYRLPAAGVYSIRVGNTHVQKIVAVK